MRRGFFVLILAGILMLPAHYEAHAQQPKAMTQFSTIDALMSGVYDGMTTLGELARYGDTGIGTFHGLDGEMVVLDGVIYQVRADGTVHTPSPHTTLPFAAVTFFEADHELALREGATFETMTGDIDTALPTRNIFHAIRIDGVFKRVKTRSVPKQEKPYPPLAEVVKTQPVFEFENVEGTMIGWRCPSFAKGINVPGYHLHFLTKDRKAGGHVLDCTVLKAAAKIDHTSDFRVILPDSRDFYRLNLEGDSGTASKSVFGK